jgi:processive 1,2-diacylglycerol beta-glucosyltransferase
MLSSTTEPDRQVLIDGPEEESSEDQDYYINADTIELLGDGRATDHLFNLLRTALGSKEGVEIRWKRR